MHWRPRLLNPPPATSGADFTQRHRGRIRLAVARRKQRFFDFPERSPRLMNDGMKPARVRNYGLDPSVDLSESLSSRVFGQPAAVSSIVPYVQMYQAKLALAGRPVGVFLLLGPTGTGKTKTVESLAEVLHGSEKSLLRIDCGEFQMEHEVARLVGAPPGYLGHRETQPMITQPKLNAATSENCGLSLVLFDEIEKAAPSLSRLLLGVLDKAVLHLGDNSTVNFENSLIFLTSNLGARNMFRELQPDFGFRSMVAQPASGLARKLEKIGISAVRRKFPPEFVNRIDVTITYQPLSSESLAAVLNHHIEEFRMHVHNRLGATAFDIDVSVASRRFLLREGTSVKYGARELKRTLQRRLIQPIAAMVARCEIEPNSTLRVDYSEDTGALRMLTRLKSETAGAAKRSAAPEATGREAWPSTDGNPIGDPLRLTA